MTDQTATGSVPVPVPVPSSGAAPNDKEKSAAKDAAKLQPPVATKSPSPTTSATQLNVSSATVDEKDKKDKEKKDKRSSLKTADKDRVEKEKELKEKDVYLRHSTGPNLAAKDEKTTRESGRHSHGPKFAEPPPRSSAASSGSSSSAAAAPTATTPDTRTPTEPAALSPSPTAAAGASSSSSENKKPSSEKRVLRMQEELDNEPESGHPAAEQKASPTTPVNVNLHLLESVPPDVLEKIKGWKVRQAALHGGKGKTTSKTHPFKPPAAFQEAMDFLKSQSVKSCTLVFTNSSAIGFADGKFVDFDNFEDDDDE